MKKQKIQIVSVAAAAAMLLQTGVSAFGGTYPASHPDLPAFSASGMQENSSMESWQKSDANHLFTVDGQTFILLDTDEAGNYFVMTEDVYGYHQIDSSYSSNPQFEYIGIGYDEDGKEVPITDEEGNLIFNSKLDMNTIDDNQWKYNPEDTNNIAYWLNNDFLANGNKGKKLPDAIVNNLLEKTWDIEGFQARANWTANDWDKKYGITRAADFAASRSMPKYTVGGKLALMSFTEYKKYQDIIGFKYGEKGWNGFGLRTPHALINTYEAKDGAGKVIERGIRYTWGGVQVVNQGSEAAPKTGKMKICTIDAPANAETYVRPVMWLGKDFFKTVKVDVKNAGYYSKAEILKYPTEDLEKIYSADELTLLKGKNPTWDWGHYPEHPSDVKRLVRTSTNANGIPTDSPAENLFTIGGRRFILLDRNMNGEYFVMADEEYGQRPWLPERYLLTLPSDRSEWMSDVWSFNPEVTDSVPYSINSELYGLLSNDINRAFSYTGGYNGNTDKKIIPTEMLDDLLETNWELEPFYPDLSWKVDGAENPSSGDDDTVSEETKAEIKSWLDKQLEASAKKTVKAKLSFLSYTEYQVYKDKIGFKNNLVPDLSEDERDYSYAGTYLRTPYAMVDGGEKAADGTLSNVWRVVPGPMTLLRAKDGTKVTYSYSNISDDKYMIRPVMWLAKDFFKNNKIDVDTAGENVFCEIRDLYTADDLKDTYSISEIAKMGIDVGALTDVKFTYRGEDIEDLAYVDEISVSANAVNLGQNETMIVAVYNNGNLVGVDFTNVDFTDVEVGASKPVYVTVYDLRGADECKVMLWSALNGENAMTPIYTTSF